MKRELFVFVLMFSRILSCDAASLLWDGAMLKIGSSGAGSFTLEWDGLGNGAPGHPLLALHPCLFLSVDSRSGITTLRPIFEALAAYGDDWRQLELGETVGPETMLGNQSFFFKGGLDVTGSEGFRSDYDIVVPFRSSTSVFLAFATRNDLFDEGNPPEICYGWVELLVSEGSLSVLHSAPDLSGAPLVAGQIPEPSSAALALFGTALLLRRRLRTPMS